MISDKFSQPWEVYRIITSDLPNMPKLHELNAYYTYDMIQDLLEMLDVRDGLNQEQVLKQREAMKQQSRST